MKPDHSEAKLKVVAVFVLWIFASSLVGAADGTSLVSEISGFLVDAEGHRAPGRVALLPLLSHYDRHRSLIAGREAPRAVEVAEVGDDDRFTLEVPASGVWSVVATAPDRIPMRYVPLPVVGSVELPPLTWVVDVAVNVRVRWSDGRPVEEAWVLVTTGSPELWRDVLADGWQIGPRIGRTDAEGRITLPRRPEESSHVHVFSGGARATASLPSGAPDIELELEPPAARRVIEIRDEAGSAMEGVVLTAGDPAWPVGVTGERGRLSVPADLEGPFGFLLEDGRRDERDSLPVAKNGDSPALVRLGPPPRREGKVLDASTRRPVVGALVWPGDDPGAFARTDDRGIYTVSSSASRTWVQAEATGYLPRAVRLPQVEGSERIPALALERSRALSGRIVDATGAPVRDAVITVARERRSESEAFRLDRAAGRAVSDEEGEFRIPGLAAAPTYRITVKRSGYQTSRSSVSGRDPLRLVLTRARLAHGLVVDSRQRPLTGVQVKIRPTTPGPRGDDEVVTAVTDSRGRFRVPGLPADEIDLEARHEGFAPLEVPGIDVAPGSGAVDLGTLVLLVGNRITGRVTAGEGRPLEGARVWRTDPDRPPSPALARVLRRRPADAVTDVSGRFAIPDLSEGHRASLLVALQGYLPTWRTGVEAPTAEPLMVELEPASSLAGRVEEVAGEPVSGALVRLRPAPPPPGTVGVAPMQSVNTADTRTDGRGRFTFDEVSPGDVLLEVRAEGFLPGEPVEIHVPKDDDPREARLVLERGAVVEGRITDSAGGPVAGARARVGPAQGESDAEGRYLLDGVPLGLAALVVTHPAYPREIREIRVEAGNQRMDVTLEPGLTVSGRVADPAGRPQLGATVTLTNLAERGPRGFQATTDVEGRFRIPAVVDGTFELEAVAEGFSPTVHPERIEVAGRDVEGLDVVLRPGTTLSGRIYGVALEKVTQVEVTAQRGDRPARFGTLDYEGRFEIPHLEAGRWHLRARLAGGRREAETWVDVAPEDREVQRDLELGGGLVLEGIVYYEDRPLTRAQVSVRGLDSTLDRNVTTDYQGTFRFEGLEPGNYRLEVVHGEHMLSQSRDLELTGDREIVVDMVPTRLSGTVVAADTGEGIPDALVYLHRLVGGSEGPLTTVGTDATGSFVTASLAPGRYRVIVRRDGYGPEELQVDVGAGQTAEPLIFELEPTAGLWLKVRRAAGPPPARATVVVLDPGGSTVHVEEALLKFEGYGYLRQIPPGTWTLLIKASDAAYGLARAVVPGEGAEVTLPPGAPLTVRVPQMLESRVAAGLAVTGTNGSPHFAVEPGGAVRTTWPLLGGVVTVSDLPAGEWRLQVTAADGRTWNGAVVTDGQTAVTATME